MDLTTIYLCVGFALASYSVIANDSVQTLGTWIASNSEKFKWQQMWMAASAVLLFTIWYGWFTYGGDISYGRLNKIPWQPIQWYHAVAPLILVLLTRFGVPVSTTFLVLSAFASTVVLEKVLLKSAMGYLVAASAAYLIWMVVAKYLETKDIPEEHKKYWRIGQWCTTGWLWFTWLSHDMANIAVYLDQSGSVSDADLQLLASELEGLAKRVEFTLFNFDTEVDEKSERQLKKGRPVHLVRTRCGGTDFRCVQDHANKNSGRFDGYLVLTDGFAPDPGGRNKLKRGWVIVPTGQLQFSKSNRDFLITMKNKPENKR